MAVAARTRSRAHLRDQPERALVVIVLALTCFGLLMVYSATSAPAVLSDGNPLGFATRQILFIVVGLGAFLVALRVRPRAMQRVAPKAVLASLVLLVAVLVPGIGVEVKGATRWLSVGAFQVQPSEVAKLALALWIAQAVARDPTALRVRGGLIPFLGLTGVMALLIVVEPDLGTAITLVAMVLAMLLVAGARSSRLGGALAIGAGLALVAILMEPFRLQRLLSFLDPWADPQGTGFQAVQAQVALGSGGLFGTGLGNGIQKANYLPEAHTDMILATVGEELGLVGVMVVLVAYGALGIAGYRIAMRARDLHGQVLAAGITTLLVVQAIVNMGAVLGLLPITGVPLPFVSYGGSSLVIFLFSAGLLANIGRRAARDAGRLRLVDHAPGEDRDRGGGDGRARDARAGGGRRAHGARG